ncbi:MAG TPA: hypothetical protein VHX37_13365 [Acidobacteriaceae bacterium]|jgi:hypothetical protein|nr:hypothetical protein [Acidobacteriaceae bacterium]
MSTLFANLPEQRAVDLDCSIGHLLRGRVGGPFKTRLTEDEAAVLTGIRYHRGTANAITIAALRERTKLGEREIKAIVRALRINFRLPIGASKNSSTGGYFLVLTPEDLALAMKSPLDQIRAELAVVRALGGDTREILGQLTLEVGE